MKRLFFLALVISLCLSACVLDRQLLTPITIGSVTHLDGGLLVPCPRKCPQEL